MSKFRQKKNTEIFKRYRLDKKSRDAVRSNQVLEFFSKRGVNISREELHELSTKLGEDFFFAHESNPDWYEGPDNYYSKGRGFEAIEIKKDSIKVPGIQVFGVSSKSGDTGHGHCGNPQVICESDNDKLLWMLLELLKREDLSLNDKNDISPEGSRALLSQPVLSGLMLPLMAQQDGEQGRFDNFLKEEKPIEKLQIMLTRLRGRNKIAETI